MRINNLNRNIGTIQNILSYKQVFTYSPVLMDATPHSNLKPDLAANKTMSQSEALRLQYRTKNRQNSQLEGS